jgi:hypothetical protein
VAAHRAYPTPKQQGTPPGRAGAGDEHPFECSELETEASRSGGGRQNAGVAEPPFEFDVALSFAGEDRAYVHAVAERLRDEGVRVFYDEFMPVELWGEDLYILFDEIFRKRARYVVAFISHHYVSKPWTTHERQSAQARSLFEPQAFLLPVRLDDSELPGLRPTVGHIDARKIDEAALTALILKKLGRGNRSPAPVREIDRVPRSTEEEAVLLANRPAGWEYLLFASILRREKEALEPKWRDHELGFVQPHALHERLV